VCITRSNYVQYIVENTMSVPARIFIAWEAASTVTFLGPATVYIDAANGNRPYTWFVVPANVAGYVALTTSDNAGLFSWWGSKAQFASCTTSVFIPAGITNDFCWNVEFDLSTLRYQIQISTTQYTPIRYSFTFSSTNAKSVLQTDGGVTVASPYTLTVDGRPPPTGSVVPGRIVGYIVPAYSGVNGWYVFTFDQAWRYGDPAAFTNPTTARYTIPFRGTFPVIQGNGGSLNHQAGAYNQYALDFAMPEGTAIYAARAGYVSFVEESNSMSSWTACPSNPLNCGVVGATINYVRVIHVGM
jgi:hypothetical protein